MAGIKEFDQAKDYYGILGVEHKATAEELKAAHVKLALKHHPDVSTSTKENELGANSNPEFLEISEAWAVLSKPELRSRYDTARGLFTRSSENIPDTSRMIAKDFLVQRAQYEHVRKHATTSWMDTQDKYKKESWLSKPLSERKAARVRPIAGFGSTIVKIAFPFVLVMGGLLGMTFAVNQKFGNEKDQRGRSVYGR